MKIIDVQPKDIYVTTEFSMLQLKWLYVFLSGSKVEFDSDRDPEMADAVEYVVNKLFPDLEAFLNEMEKR